MSGVVAVLAPHAPADERRSSRDAMLGAMPHRGAHLQRAEVGGAAVGVVSHDDQPAVAQDGGWAAALAGTVDDGLPGLVTHGPDRSNPAELLLRAFREGGPASVPGLRGAFAAVVTDGVTLWAWRDHVGLSPLFHRSAEGDVWVASEPKAVVAGAGLARTPDLAVVEAIFYGRYDDDTPSAVSGVARLPKATLLTAGVEGTTTGRYWDPLSLVETRPPIGREELQREFDRLMAQAVRRVMRGPDVVSLSGGVDSPAVAAYAAPQHQELFGSPLPALSTVYPDLPSVDEREWIELVAERFGMPLETYRPTNPRLARLDEWTRLFDGPVPTIWFDEVEENYVRAAQRGHRHILTGEFAEYVIEMRQGVVDHLVRQGRYAGAARFLAAKRRGGARPSTIARMVAGAVVPEPLLRAYRRRHSDFGGLPVPEWIDAGRLDRVSPTIEHGRNHRWRQAQITGFDGPGISVEADEFVQARCGVLVRRPWIDIDLWEFWLSLRAEDKFPESRYKGLVKGLLRGRVPDEILDRRTFTTFDDDIMTKIDWDGLRRWLVDPGWTMPGVDYALLAERLEARTLTLEQYIWARDLAAAHAFVEG